jgi:hypothetical protein
MRAPDNRSDVANRLTRPLISRCAHRARVHDYEIGRIRRRGDRSGRLEFFLSRESASSTRQPNVMTDIWAEGSALTDVGR